MTTSTHDALLYMAQAFQSNHYRHLGGEKKNLILERVNLSGTGMYYFKTLLPMKCSPVPKTGHNELLTVGSSLGFPFTALNC